MVARKGDPVLEQSVSETQQCSWHHHLSQEMKWYWEEPTEND